MFEHIVEENTNEMILSGVFLLFQRKGIRVSYAMLIIVCSLFYLVLLNYAVRSSASDDVVQ